MAKSKRKPASGANNSKTKTRHVKRTFARKGGQLKPVTEPATHQRRPSASQPTARRESKKAHIIAMLRAPGGADHRCDGTCSEVATPFGPRLPRRCRAQEARPYSCLGRRRERARLPDYGWHGVSGGVE